MPKKNAARRRPAAHKSSQSESWQAIFVQHVNPRLRRSTDAVDDALEIGHGRAGSTTFQSVRDFEQHAKFAQLAGSLLWVALMRVTGHLWLHVFAAKMDAAFAARLARSKQLHIIFTGYDGDARKTEFDFYSAGKRVVHMEMIGPLDEPFEKMVFKSTIHGERFTKSLTTPADAIERLLKERGAACAPCAIRQVGETLRCKPKLDNGVEQICIRSFYRLRSIKGSPGNRLAKAIDTGDIVKLRQAVTDGASLEFLPESSGSALRTTMLNRKKNWQQCARELVRAGAPIDGFPHEDPLIFCATCRFADADSNLAAAKLAIELGADVNSVMREARTRLTPLHQAVANGHLALVKYLVSQGADVQKNTPAEKRRARLPRGFMNQFTSKLPSFSRQRRKDALARTTSRPLPARKARPAAKNAAPRAKKRKTILTP